MSAGEQTWPLWVNTAELVFDESLWTWQSLRPGVDWVELSPQGVWPRTALLRYQAGTSVPWHRHEGHEHILVLRGSQQDEHGHYPAGNLRINPPGSSHQVRSEEGCVVLIIWQQPLRFFD